MLSRGKERERGFQNSLHRPRKIGPYAASPPTHTLLRGRWRGRAHSSKVGEDEVGAAAVGGGWELDEVENGGKLDHLPQRQKRGKLKSM